MMSHEDQRHQHLASESTDERRREPNEAIGFDELVEIDAQKLHSDAQMIPEVEVLCHLDNIVLLFRVLWFAVRMRDFKTVAY